MIKSFKRILVLCPGDAVSGGPELLHQLVSELRKIGKEAAIVYYPFDQKFETPDAYLCYKAPQSAFSDIGDQVIVLPEIRADLVRKIKHSTVYIWWLSVDNFFGLLGGGRARDMYRYWSKIIRGGRPILRSLRSSLHLAQSYYALDFLNRNGISASLLTDYLSTEHLLERSSAIHKRDIVAYNPKKGGHINSLLVRALPNVSFFPIENMSKAQVADLLSTAKIYMDFGNHPGKDRIPREAAMAGCCVITGRRGSAAYDEDVPIPAEYKLDDRSRRLPALFQSLAMSIFDDYQSRSQDFVAYRRQISLEPNEFRHQVRNVFGDI